MNRRSFALSSLAVLTLPLSERSAWAQAAVPTAPLSASQIMARVQLFYNGAKTFKAGFRQKYTAKIIGKSKESAGVVTFEKPGKMSWRYTSNGNRVVSDGQLIKIYEQQNQQLFEQPITHSQMPAALSFLTGQGKLNQSFQFTQLSSAALKFPTGFVVQGTPLQATPAYDRVLFYVDRATFHVRRVIIIDAQQNRNSFDFVSPQVNQPAPAGEFQFSPPPGTQIIR